MDNSAFSTQAVKTSAVTGNGKALQAKTGVFAGGPGMNFMDIIFANMTAAAQAMPLNQAGQAQTPLFQTAQAKMETPATALATSSSDSALVSTDGTPADLEGMLAQVLQAAENSNIPDEAPDTTVISPEAQQKLLAFLKNLMKGMPENTQPTLETLKNGLLKNAATLTASAGEITGDPAPLVSNLTPEQLAAVLKKILEGDDSAADDAAMMAGLVQIVPPDTKKEAVFQPRLLVQAAAVPAKTDAASEENNTSGVAPEQAGLTSLTSKDGETESGFDKVLRIFESAQKAGNKYVPNAAIPSANNSAVTAGTVAHQAGALSGTVSWDTIYPEGMSLSAVHPGGTGVTGAAPLTSIVVQTPQAGYPHPAAQQVVAAMARTLDGEAKSMTLRLDPPELGRVSVKMEFNKNDKTVKAVIMAERPETFLMLQRDSHVLQRSLQDAGLDPGAGGLTFQLSQDGNMAGQNQNGNGQSYSGASSFSNDDGDIVTETTLNWSVDQDTGLTHYNILA